MFQLKRSDNETINEGVKTTIATLGDGIRSIFREVRRFWANSAISVKENIQKGSSPHKGILKSIDNTSI